MSNRQSMVSLKYMYADGIAHIVVYYTTLDIASQRVIWTIFRNCSLILWLRNHKCTCMHLSYECICINNGMYYYIVIDWIQNVWFTSFVSEGVNNFSIYMVVRYPVISTGFLFMYTFTIMHSNSYMLIDFLILLDNLKIPIDLLSSIWQYIYMHLCKYAYIC